MATYRTSSGQNGLDPAAIQLASKPSYVEHKNMRFLIMDRPTEVNLPTYLRELKKVGVTDIVRVCHEQTYSAAEVSKQAILMHEIPFDDGKSPPPEVIQEWLKVVKGMRDNSGCVAIHCVAGLGRAPSLVAVALIEAGMSAADAVAFIRKERRGAINKRQIDFLREYEKTVKKSPCSCTIS